MMFDKFHFRHLIDMFKVGNLLVGRNKISSIYVYFQKKAQRYIIKSLITFQRYNVDNLKSKRHSFFRFCKIILPI